jgi:hypothetical protein
MSQRVIFRRPVKLLAHDELMPAGEYLVDVVNGRKVIARDNGPFGLGTVFPLAAGELEDLMRVDNSVPS